MLAQRNLSTSPQPQLGWVGVCTVLLQLLPGCGDAPTAPPPPPAPVASVTVLPETATLVPQQTVQLTATPRDAAGKALSGRTVAWSSSAQTVATVSTSGLVTAVATGTAVIRATSQGISGQSTVTVLTPVASVTVAPDVATLVAQQTLQLTATLQDSAGNELSGRTVAWSSSAAAVATVSTTGLVTAITPGQAVITAASEGKLDSATVLVADGGIVTTQGGVVVAAGGAVRIDVPSGALAANTVLTVTPVAQLPPFPAGNWLVGGAIYQLGPEGSSFAQPVTVTIAYDPAMLPPWATPADLTLQRWDGKEWKRADNVVVDAAARTISGRATGFSIWGPATATPAVIVTPIFPEVNEAVRSVKLTAYLQGPTAQDIQGLTYTWTTTGNNGLVNTPINNTAQYTATMPVLPKDGRAIDDVTVEVYGVPPGSTSPQLIGKRSVTIKLALEPVFELVPSSQLLLPGQSYQLRLVAKKVDPNQQVVEFPLPTDPDPTQSEWRFEWTKSPSIVGDISPSGLITAQQITYTAKPESQQPQVFPRGDKVTVKVQKRGDPILDENRVPTDSYTWIDKGSVDAFVEVLPDYKVRLVPEAAPLKPGESVVLQVELEPAWQGTETLSYRWRTTGNYGSLSVAQNELTQQGAVTYQAKSGSVSGTDYVDVDVYVGIFPPRGPIGSARASVTVRTAQTLYNKYFAIFCQSGGQLCSPIYQVPFSSSDLPTIAEFSSASGHCSPVTVHFILDGQEIAKPTFTAGPNQPYVLPLGTLSPGGHVLDLQGEGNVGGCNRGTLLSWGGTIIIREEP